MKNPIVGLRANFLKTCFLLGAMGLVFNSADSWAMPVLKHVQVKNSTEFYLVFDGKVEESQITSEYVNDIFQMNLKNVSVYPAKIIPIPTGVFSKIFAYQYSPKLVRCRFTIKAKTKMSELKRKLKITTQGEVVTVKLIAPMLASKELAAPRAEGFLGERAREERRPTDSKVELKKSSDGERAQLVENSAENAEDALDEQALLQKVIHGTEPTSPVEKKPEVRGAQDSHGAMDSGDALGSLNSDSNGRAVSTVTPINEKGRLTGGKPLPAIWPVVVKLGGVVLLFCLLAAFLKRAKGTPSGKAWLKNVGKFAKKSLTKNRDMIQVISTHHLDQKKSLAVVKVAGRLLVLGVSNDAINLITQISGQGDDLDFENDPDLSQIGLSEDPAFADFLGTAKVKPTSDSFAQARGTSAYSDDRRTSMPQFDESPSLVPSARSRIKNKLEGLKQL